MNNYEDDNRIQINALLEEIKAELAHARGTM